VGAGSDEGERGKKKGGKVNGRVAREGDRKRGGERGRTRSESVEVGGDEGGGRELSRSCLKRSRERKQVVRYARARERER